MLLAGMAFAQGDYAINEPGENYAEASQEITIIIPERVALHLTDTAYTLDLNDPQAYVPGNSSVHDGLDTSGVGCSFILPSQVSQIADGLASGGWAGVKGYLAVEYLAVTNAAMHGGVSTYPAAVLDQDDNVVQSGDQYLKGHLVCIHRKTVQMFSNAPGGFHLEAGLTLPGSLGQFGMIGRMGPTAQAAFDAGFKTGQSEGNYRHLLGSGASSDLLLLTAGGTSGGWVDAYITELFYFDGTETPTATAGDTFTINYVITGNF